MMGRIRMESHTKKHLTRRKAKERKHKFLELTEVDSCCCCAMKAKRDRKLAQKRAAKFADLPEEIVLKIISYFSLSDLLRFSQVSKYHQTIINQSQVIWANISFQALWPKSRNMKVFEKAAECGNIECLAKLAFVSLYIYNFKGTRKCLKTSLENANKAVASFSRIDQLISPELPLTWMFIRPPWAYPVSVRKCLKECMLNKIEETCTSDKISIPALYNVGKTYLFKEDETREQACEFFEKAAALGCPYSNWELYKCKGKGDDDEVDAGVMLETVRNLQDIASRGHFRAIVELCKKYSMTGYSNVTRKTATEFCRKVMDMCSPSGIHNIIASTSRNATRITENMRCILVNWMHEVCDVKSMQSEALHMAVDCVDRYLLNRNVNRKQVQLIGISCVVLASKVFSTNSSSLLTIRESAWLTDSTYEYNEVVKMLAEIIGALKGKLFKMNANHFGEIMCTLAKLDVYNGHFMHYLIDSSLQFCDFGRFKPSLVAAAATMLTLIVNKSADAWPSYMVDFTGYEVKDLANCVALLHTKCLLDITVVVDGDHQISGARDRYSAVEFMEVAKRPVPDLATVRSCIDDLEPRLRSKVDNGFLKFNFKEERNMLDSVSDTSVTNSFLCGYDGDEEDNEGHSLCDTSLFSGKEQHRPTLDGFVPEVFSEETNKFSPQHYFLDDSDLCVTRPGSESCVCGTALLRHDRKEGKEVSMDKLTAVFSTACSCSSSALSRSSDTMNGTEEGLNKPSMSAKKRHSVRLRKTQRCKDSTSPKEGNENSDRERRKRPANWPVGYQPERKGTLRPKIDSKGAKVKPWRY